MGENVRTEPLGDGGERVAGVVERLAGAPDVGHLLEEAHRQPHRSAPLPGCSDSAATKRTDVSGLWPQVGLEDSVGLHDDSVADDALPAG